LSSLKNNSSINTSLYHSLTIDKNGTAWRDELHEEYICDFTHGFLMLGKMILKTRATALIIEADCDLHSDLLRLCCLLLENDTVIVLQKPLAEDAIRFMEATCRVKLNSLITLNFNPWKFEG